MTRRELGTAVAGLLLHALRWVCVGVGVGVGLAAVRWVVG